MGRRGVKGRYDRLRTYERSDSGRDWNRPTALMHVAHVIGGGISHCVDEGGGAHDVLAGHNVKRNRWCQKKYGDKCVGTEVQMSAERLTLGNYVALCRVEKTDVHTAPVLFFLFHPFSHSREREHASASAS